MKTEIDKMKKIVFSKLWEYNAYYKVGSIRLQYKRFGRVCMNKKWGNCERSLQKLKGIINFNPLRKRSILPNQLNKRGHYNNYWKIVGSEMSIKVGKSKKTLDILNWVWSSPINNGLNLTKIHENAISRNYVTQEFHFRLMEFTLLQCGVKSNLPKFF